MGLKETSIGICLDKCISFFQPGKRHVFLICTPDGEAWKPAETYGTPRELNLLYKVDHLLDAARSNRAGHIELVIAGQHTFCIFKFICDECCQKRA